MPTAHRNARGAAVMRRLVLFDGLRDRIATALRMTLLRSG
jgi:hypothetical protein